MKCLFSSFAFAYYSDTPCIFSSSSYLRGPGHLEVYLDLPVSDPARQLVPDGALPRPVVRGQSDVAGGDHGAALEVPVGHPEP